MIRRRKHKTHQRIDTVKITHEHQYIKVFNASGKSVDVSGSQDGKTRR